MPSNVYDPAACVATRCPAAKAIERAADAVTIALLVAFPMIVLWLPGLA